MNATERPPLAKPGDMLTLIGRIRKVYGPGPRVAMVDTIGGSVMVPLSVDGMLPDPGVTVEPGPRIPEQHVPCGRCGR